MSEGEREWREGVSVEEVLEWDKLQRVAVVSECLGVV